MRWLPLLLLLATTAGCWQPRYFAPRENENGTGPDGDPAALYPIELPGHDGTRGSLRVWSRGASARFADDDREVVDLRIGFELENNGATPLELQVDGVLCEEVMVGGVLRDPLAPESVVGSGYAAPGSTTRVDLVFRPPTTRPRDVESFAVRFEVRDGDGGSFGESTPFAPSARYGDRSPAWGWGGYYGFWGPWGWPGYGGYYYRSGRCY